MWALGITAYTLVYGRLPFYSDNAAALFERIQNGAVEYPAPASSDSETVAEAQAARAFLERALAQNPVERAGADELRVRRVRGCVLPVWSLNV